MGKGLDLVKLYPDLFEGLDEETIEIITEVLANNWLEGWKPNRGDVADLIAHDRGEIDDDEYTRRGAERARAVASRQT